MAETGVEFVERARATSDRGEIVLRERVEPDRPEGSPGVLELRVNGIFVMDTLQTASERGLAATALAAVTSPRRVVVGGLGLGFTVHEVLADSRVEEVHVVEIEDAVVAWMRDGTIPHGPSYLADERLTVVSTDIRVAVSEARHEYDLVLLDVDNGPDHLVYDDNADVYAAPFLTRLRELLAPDGAVAIWSADDAPALEERMTHVFGNCERLAYDVDLQGRDEEYLLYLSRRTH